jgi:hypothetical protein
MTLTATKLRAVVNLLSDPGSAANAAGILAREAKERGSAGDGVDPGIQPTPLLRSLQRRLPRRSGKMWRRSMMAVRTYSGLASTLSVWLAPWSPRRQKLGASRRRRARTPGVRKAKSRIMTRIRTVVRF